MWIASSKVKINNWVATTMNWDPEIVCGENSMCMNGVGGFVWRLFILTLEEAIHKTYLNLTILVL